MYKSKKPYLYTYIYCKSSVARVHLFPNGTGAITINGRDIDDYFGLETLKLIVRQPPGRHRHPGQGGYRDHRGGRRRHRPGRRHPSRRGPRPAAGQPRVPRHPQGRRLPHPRPSYEGAQEVRPQGCSSRASVQQALIICRRFKNPAASAAGFFLRSFGAPSQMGRAARRVQVLGLRSKTLMPGEFTSPEQIRSFGVPSGGRRPPLGRARSTASRLLVAGPSAHRR